jgi:hypothetical protein
MKNRGWSLGPERLAGRHCSCVDTEDAAWVLGVGETGAFQCQESWPELGWGSQDSEC